MYKSNRMFLRYKFSLLLVNLDSYTAERLKGDRFSWIGMRTRRWNNAVNQIISLAGLFSLPLFCFVHLYRLCVCVCASVVKWSTTITLHRISVDVYSIWFTMYILGWGRRQNTFVNMCALPYISGAISILLYTNMHLNRYVLASSIFLPRFFALSFSLSCCLFSLSLNRWRLCCRLISAIVLRNSDRYTHTQNWWNFLKLQHTFEWKITTKAFVWRAIVSE